MKKTYYRFVDVIYEKLELNIRKYIVDNIDSHDIREVLAILVFFGDYFKK